MPGASAGFQITAAAQLGADVVTGAKIQDGTIADADIAANAAITLSKIPGAKAGGVFAGTVVRVGNAADGAVNVPHGLGRVPDLVLAFAVKTGSSGPVAHSIGFLAGVASNAIYLIDSLVAALSGRSSGSDGAAAITISDNTANSALEQCTISATTTNIVMTWMKTGAPSADNISIVLIAI